MRRRRSITALALLVALCAPAACSAEDGGFPARYVAGEHYTQLDETAPTTAPDGKVEVVEFFLYSCPHCFHFDPEVRDWVKQLPEDVAFRRVPVLFGGAGPVYARVFYTAKDLGVLDKLHTPIFNAIHEDGDPLNRKADIRKFFVAHGVDGDAFDRTFDSEQVTRQVAESGALMRAYGVTSVPSFGVAGNYWINGRQAGSNPAMLDIADYLVGQARESQ